SGKISAFADILGEVEQLRATVLVMFDQFPVAITDRAGRLAALIGVVREMPVEWAWLRLAATHEERGDTDTVEIARRPGTGDFRQCRQPVGVDDGCVHETAGGDVARPAHDKGDAQAAFVEVTLAGA